MTISGEHELTRRLELEREVERLNAQIETIGSEGDPMMIELRHQKAEVERLDGQLKAKHKLLADHVNEVERLKAENEKLQVQLAGCSVAALGGTNNIAKQGDFGWSASYQDVVNLYARKDKLCEALEKARTYLEERGIRHRDQVGRLEVLPMIDEALKDSKGG